MPCCNNLFNVKILAVATTGMINLGNSIQVNPTSNIVDMGGSTPVGDGAANVNGGGNSYFDPDFADQLGNFLP